MEYLSTRRCISDILSAALLGRRGGGWGRSGSSDMEGRTGGRVGRAGIDDIRVDGENQSSGAVIYEGYVRVRIGGEA